MTFDPTITLGSVIQSITLIVALIGAYYAMRGRFDIFTLMIGAHTESLTKHATRLDRHEERIIELVSGLQRVIGQSDIVFHAHVRQEDMGPSGRNR